MNRPDIFRFTLAAPTRSHPALDEPVVAAAVFATDLVDVDSDVPTGDSLHMEVHGNALSGVSVEEGMFEVALVRALSDVEVRHGEFLPSAKSMIPRLRQGSNRLLWFFAQRTYPYGQWN